MERWTPIFKNDIILSILNVKSKSPRRNVKKAINNSPITRVCRVRRDKINTEHSGMISHSGTLVDDFHMLTNS